MHFALRGTVKTHSGKASTAHLAAMLVKTNHLNKVCESVRGVGMRELRRGYVWDIKTPESAPESLAQLNARRITALSHSSRHRVLNIISQFLGNQHLNSKLIPKCGRSFLPEHVHPLNDCGSPSKRYSMFRFGSGKPH